MRPPRSVLAVAGLTALMVVPAGAQGASMRAVGFQAKVVSVSAKSRVLKARVLTVSGSGLSKYKGKTLSFDLRKAKLTVSDTNNDGKANTIADIKRKDLVGVIGAAPTGTLPKLIAVTTLNDLTALLPTPTLPPPTPGAPILPPVPGVGSGS